MFSVTYASRSVVSKMDIEALSASISGRIDKQQQVNGELLLELGDLRSIGNPCEPAEFP